MRKLYEARDRIEAQLIHDYLESRGLETVILGDFLAGAAGELPANIFPAIWVVDNHNLEPARRLLAQYLDFALKAPQSGPWHCGRCGEEVDGAFEICWNCSSPKPD